MTLQDKFINSFAFYGAYHQNKTNRIIHIITIPLIIYTIFVWLSYIEIYRHNDWAINPGIFLIAIYTLIYSILDIIGGLLFSIFAIVLYITATIFRYNSNYAWQICIPIHIVSWLTQFAGHSIFEHKRPALFDSLIQAFVMAPFFVFMEVLFEFGYNSELEQKIDIATSEKLCELGYVNRWDYV